MRIRSTFMRRWVLGLHARPWVRAAVLVWLFAGIMLVSFHQHHDSSAGHDCALCAAAHTPATVPQASGLLDAPQVFERPIATITHQDTAAAFRIAFPSRAPPIA